ncbi:neck passage structure [Lactococcus phage MV16]|uniref:Neck passage structure n=1 Tax=Lactococcus phage MV16 TaxID=2500820 RepID=A0A482N7H1_9CAUD|nr:neck passage structure [Lactococcus phage MV16]
MSLDNFRNRTILWDTVNKDFPQPIQTMQGDVNARTLLIKIVDNGTEVDLTGHSLKLTYHYTNSSNSGLVMIPPKDLAKGEFILVIPTEMTATGVIEANLILLNKDKEQVIVSKNLTFISDNSTVSDLAQEVNNKIDDFTKLLLANMPQVMRSELNDLHAQTESNKSNIELKANLADMTSLQSAMTELKKEVEAFGISPENLVTIKSLLDAIASNASESEVAELINSVKVLTSNISMMSNGDYSPKANQTDLESLQYTVNDHSATISAKANQTDLNNLQATVDKQGISISEKAEQSELSITNKNVATAQETANKAESEAKNAMAKATEAQANSLPLNGNAVSASKLATPRKLGVNLQSSSFQYFDGTADATNIGVSGVLPIANGGTSTSDGVINTTAYANSADGTDGFTTVYPNLNLGDNTKTFVGAEEAGSDLRGSIKIDPATQKTQDGDFVYLTYKPVKGYVDWFRFFLIPDAATPNMTKVAVKPNTKYTFSFWAKGSGEHTVFAYRDWTSQGVQKINLTLDWALYTCTVTSSNVIPAGNVQFFIRSNAGTEINLKKPKVEEGPIATPWMPSASEITIADYPKYVGFSNSIKPNKKSSDYKWLPMGLVSIDRATGSLKPAVIGIDCAEAHPVGSVVTNTSSSSSGYSTGKWENIGSAVIGSTTIYYWKRTA